MENSKPQTLHYFMVLATVYFLADGQMNILDTQFFASGPDQKFPAHRLQQLQNVAAQQVANGQEPNSGFMCSEVHFKTISYLGEFTADEFWKGLETTAGAKQAGVSQPVAADATDTPNNGGTVTPIRPGVDVAGAEIPADSDGVGNAGGDGTTQA